MCMLVRRVQTTCLALCVCLVLMMFSQFCGFLPVLQYLVLVEIATARLNADVGRTAVNLAAFKHVMYAGAE